MFSMIGNISRTQLKGSQTPIWTLPCHINGLMQEVPEAADGQEGQNQVDK